jgi:hypothetical protein
MITFRVATHQLTKDVTCVEVWDDDVFIAAIYGADNQDPPTTLKVISKHPLAAGAITAGPGNLSTAWVFIRAGKE